MTPLALLAVTLLPSADLRLAAQSVTVNVTGDAVVVRAPGFTFIKAETLKRLRDGRSVRVDLQLDVLLKPGVTTSIQTRQAFILSYDLWEERFAITQATVPPRSISHLTQTGAEAWCVEQMAVPVKSLSRLGHDVPFWIRLEYRVLDGDNGTTTDDDNAFTLRGLIDALSRRRKADEASGSLEAGPFWLRQPVSPAHRQSSTSNRRELRWCPGCRLGPLRGPDSSFGPGETLIPLARRWPSELSRVMRA